MKPKAYAYYAYIGGGLLAADAELGNVLGDPIVEAQSSAVDKL